MQLGTSIQNVLTWLQNSWLYVVLIFLTGSLLGISVSGQDETRPKFWQGILTWSKYLALWFGILIIGVGIGWLVGLSVSPVIANLITAIVGAAAGLIAAVNGLEGSQVRVIETARRFVPDPWPLAALVVGLFLGTSAGIWARTNDFLGKEVTPPALLTEEQLEAEIAPWVSQGISQTVVAQRLFDLRYPQAGAPSALPAPETTVLRTTETTLAMNPRAFTANMGLFSLPTAADIENCTKLLGPTNELRQTIGELQIQSLVIISNTIDDDQTLHRVVEALCTPAVRS